MEAVSVRKKLLFSNENGYVWTGPLSPYVEGKRDILRHSSPGLSGFGRNVETEASYQMLEDLSFCYRESP